MQCWVWLWSSTVARPRTTSGSDSGGRILTIAVTGKVSTEVVGASEEKSEMKFHSGSGPVEVRSARADAGVASSSTSGCRRSKRSGSVASSRGWCSWVWGILQGRTNAAEVCHGDRKIPGPAELHVAPPLAARRRDWWAVYPRRWIGCGWGAACIVTPRVRDLRRIGGVDQDTSSEFRGNYQKTIQ